MSTPEITEAGSGFRPSTPTGFLFAHAGRAESQENTGKSSTKCGFSISSESVSKRLTATEQDGKSLGTLGRIPVGNGNFVLVDDEDYEKLSAFKWRTDKDGYAIRTVRRSTARSGVSTTFLHREVLGLPVGVGIVDHINRDKLDCRKQNLRIVEHTINVINRAKRSGTSSRFVGVTRVRSRWQASCRERYIGLFRDEADAARAYDAAATREYGEFAILNFGGEQ